MKKKIFFKLTIVLSSLLVFLFIGEIALRIIGYSPYSTINHYSKPSSFFEVNHNLGWSLKKNSCCRTFINNKFSFSHCTDSNGNRIISAINQEKIESDNLVTINLYGCSYTFGYSVSDSENMGYFLQELNSKAKITNKGVPGYGLFQMYSSLKYDVIAGKKPLIAIFNYATFHDGRTPLVNAYSRDVTSVLHPNLEKNKKSYLKYLDFNEKKNIIKSIKITELPKHFMFRHYSALINLINTRIDENQYSKIQSKLNRISYLTVIEIKKFCEKNNIKLIFVGLDKDSKNLLNKLKIEGVHVVYFPIDISKPSNNCAPIDPFHPNAKVHKHYADLISMELKKIKLI